MLHKCLCRVILTLVLPCKAVYSHVYVPQYEHPVYNAKGHEFKSYPLPGQLNYQGISWPQVPLHAHVTIVSATFQPMRVYNSQLTILPHVGQKSVGIKTCVCTQVMEVTGNRVAIASSGEGGRIAGSIGVIIILL